MRLDCRFTHKGKVLHRFPTLNEYTNASRGNKYASASMKKTCTEQVAWQCSREKKITDKRSYWFHWHYTGKHDPDNISFAQKFIFDGFVMANMIPNDTLKYIGEIRHTFEKDKVDYVEVTII